eukprot:3420544-Prymnesium_polylepis.1
MKRLAPAPRLASRMMRAPERCRTLSGAVKSVALAANNPRELMASPRDAAAAANWLPPRFAYTSSDAAKATLV